MRTPSEMRVRYLQQCELADKAVEAEAQGLMAKWVQEIEQLMDNAFIHDKPIDYVVVYGNRISSTATFAAVQLAAQRTADFFQSQGFFAKVVATPASTSYTPGVKVTWIDEAV